MTLRVLIVDDEETIRVEVAEFFRNRGCEILMAGSGEEGLELIRQNPSIQLVCTDYNMHEMNGLSMVEAARHLAHTAETEFVVLTTSRSEDDRKRSRALGVKFWKVKPFRTEEFEPLLAFVQKKYEGRAEQPS
jgi:CheY-like chemotaxis protein